MQLRPYVSTVILCAITAFFCAQKHGAIILVLVIPLLVIWLAYSAYVIWKYPPRRNIQLIKAAIWALTICSIFLVHWHYYNAARNDADHVAKAIIDYKAAHGSYPQNLEAAGVGDSRRKWMLGYDPNNGKPNLWYAVTFTMFDTYSYDFETRSWTYRPD